MTQGEEGGFASPDFYVDDNSLFGGDRVNIHNGMSSLGEPDSRYRSEDGGWGSQSGGEDDIRIEHCDTVIIGNGPSALFLSYLLHGHYPVYDSETYGPHPDYVLHSKLTRSLSSVSPPSTLSSSSSLSTTEALPLYHVLDSPESYNSLTEHFPFSNLSYSSQALPVNVLLDTLLRPNGDVDPEPRSRLKWVHKRELKVPHLVIGAVTPPGGQWSEDPISASEDIRTLSYADMLSLPGYTFADHYETLQDGKEMPPFTRPTRREVSSYYSTYPKKVGIEDSILSPAYAWRVERAAGEGFFVRVVPRESGDGLFRGESMIIRCSRIVLASGLFKNVILPPKLLKPLLGPSVPPTPPPSLPLSASSSTSSLAAEIFATRDEPVLAPLLVIGSGFTAADVILSAKPHQPILHIYRWGNPKCSSPLKGCHPQAYPEYASIYRKMKIDASLGKLLALRGNEFGGSASMYQGFPNGEVVGLERRDGGGGRFVVRIKLPVPNGHPDNAGNELPEAIIEREVSSLKYCVGRRGDLGYLSPGIQKELNLSPPTSSPPSPPSQTTTNARSHLTQPQTCPSNWITNQTLRPKVENDIELARDIFVVGSLTGDSLVKFAAGGVVYTAGRIVDRFAKRCVEERDVEEVTYAQSMERITDGLPLPSPHIYGSKVSCRRSSAILESELPSPSSTAASSSSSSSSTAYPNSKRTKREPSGRPPIPFPSLPFPT